MIHCSLLLSSEIIPDMRLELMLTQDRRKTVCHLEVDGKVPVDVKRARISPREIWHQLHWGSVNMDCSDNILILSMPKHLLTLCPNRRKTQMVSDHITIQIHFKRALEPNLINIFKMFDSKFSVTLQ